MKKLVYLIVGVIVIGGGIWYATSGEKTPVAEPIPKVPQVSAATSLRGLLDEKKNLECVYKDTGEGAEIAGMIYLNQGKMAADFTTSGTAAGNVKSSIIFDGTNFYVWSSALATIGIKVPAEQFEKSGAMKSLSLDEQKAYDCKDWTPVPAKFVPPKTVTFQTVSNLLAPTAAETKAFQCAACGKLPPSQALQCKQKLACK